MPALMASRAEKSQLKRPRGSLPENGSDSKKPRRSERLSQLVTPDHTPVSHSDRLPSPIPYPSDLPAELVKDATATPPGGRTSQIPPQDVSSQSLSPPEATQSIASQLLDAQAAMAEEDEVREGVWGYLFPLDNRYTTRPTVLKKRTACPTQTSAKAIASGGYLVGRHIECDLIIDDPLISNRHCLIFNENKGKATVAVLEDLSCNGTFVNEAIVGRNQRRELEDLDEIAVLDKARFIFKYPQSRQTSAFHQQYTMLDKLGKGHFAEVYMCVEKSTGLRYAVKVFTKHPGADDPTKTDSLQQEIAVLMGVSHSNVLCLKDTFNEPTAVYLVLELAQEGELFNYIVSKHKLTEDEARKLFVQLFHGVKYLHDRNIVHRDIKPENILLTDCELHAKIADFGLAKIIGEESFTTTLCGTPSYVAPEILAETVKRKYTKAVDVWSLGVVLYICLCGFPPFSDELRTKAYPFTQSQQIRSGRFEYPSPYWDSVGDPALDLIDHMLIVDAEKRYTIDECMNHPWIKKSMSTVHDSTGGLVGGLAGLEVSRRGVKRERTLLSTLNSVHLARVSVGDKTVAVYSKNKDRVINAAVRAEPGPAYERAPDEFMQMGGKGDQPLFGNEEISAYSKDDVAAKKSAKPVKKRGR